MNSNKNSIKKFGDVFTPILLVNEMLDKLPGELWENPYLKWLDNSMGTGNFLVCIYNRLFDGLKNKIEDDEKRKKHILENMIYGVEIQEKYVFLTKHRLDLDEKYKLNLVCKDSLKFNYWNGMKFDIIVGNPPYNNINNSQINNYTTDLYPDFINLAIKIGYTYILYIVPTRFFIKKQLFNLRQKIINQYGLKILNTKNNKVFNKDIYIDGGICYILLEKDYKGFPIINGKINKYLKNIDIIIPELNEISFNIINKVKNIKSISYNIKTTNFFGIKTNDKHLKNTYSCDDIKCYTSLRNGRIKYINKNLIKNKNYINKYKVCIPAIRGNYRFVKNLAFIVHKNEVVNSSFIFFDFDKLEHAKNFKLYLNTKFVNYLIQFRKQSKHFSKDVFEWIPELNWTVEWNDEKLYKYFNLNKSEIEVIERIY